MTTATDQLANKALEIINQVQQGVIAHAPDALNLVLASTRIDAIQNLVTGLVSMLVIVSSVIFAFRMYKKFSSKEYDIFDHPEIMIITIPLIVINVFAFCGIFEVFNVWNWTGLISPKLYLAHEIIQKVMQ